MNDSLKQLIQISKTVGKDSLLIQGGGGNTSVKTDDKKYMYIKASGTALKDMNSKAGYRRLRLNSVLKIIKDKTLSKLSVSDRENEIVRRLRLTCDDNFSVIARPSIESHLHAMLDKCVIHLHPAAVLAFGCAKNGKHELQKIFSSEKLPQVWVPYADPDYMLAKRITNLVENYQKQFNTKPQILFLQKHGLLISAKNPTLAIKLLTKVIKRCNNKLAHFKPIKTKAVNQNDINKAKRCIKEAIFKATKEDHPVSFFLNNTIKAFAAIDIAPKLLSMPALTPDELLYANGPAMWLTSCDPEKIKRKLTSQLCKNQRPHIAFLVKDVGLFIAAKKKITPAVRQIVENSFFIRNNAYRMGGITCLNTRQQDFINNWEADVFRKNLAQGSG